MNPFFCAATAIVTQLRAKWMQLVINRSKYVGYAVFNPLPQVAHSTCFFLIWSGQKIALIKFSVNRTGQKIRRSEDQVGLQISNSIFLLTRYDYTRRLECSFSDMLNFKVIEFCRLYMCYLRCLSRKKCAVDFFLCGKHDVFNFCNKNKELVFMINMPHGNLSFSIAHECLNRIYLVL